MNKKMRLQKYMAHSGVASRRKSEEIIMQKRVKVNGMVVTKLGTKVNMKDLVTVDDEVINIIKKKTYILLNKPEGYVTTLDDQFDRKTVIDLIDTNLRLVPVGRLDYNTSGLLILTNDGEFVNGLSHPSNEIEKEYLVKINDNLKNEDIHQLAKGVKLKEFSTQPAKVEIVSENDKNSYFLITITEGKNREIRKLVEHFGYRVQKLKRVRIADIEIGELKKGYYRYLTKDEVNRLKKLYK